MINKKKQDFDFFTFYCAHTTAAFDIITGLLFFFDYLQHINSYNMYIYNKQLPIVSHVLIKKNNKNLH